MSNKDNNKTYGFMVVYFTTSGKRDRYLRELFFNVEKESGSTALFERREVQGSYYKYQKYNHKAFQYKEEQICAKYVNIGYHYSIYRLLILKCAIYQGSYEAFNKNYIGKSL